MSTRIGIFVAAALLTGAIGCSHPGSGLPVGSYERGIAEYEGERYLDAVQTLRLYVRRNPTDPRVDEAQYHIGLARFENDEYAVAAVEFEILRNDYPNSELIEDAWIMEGMCYVEQVPSIHHEQSVTRRALDHFLRYLQEFPDGERSEDAREQVDALRLHLDRKRMSNIRLYRRLGTHRGGAGRRPRPCSTTGPTASCDPRSSCSPPISTSSSTSSARHDACGDGSSTTTARTNSRRRRSRSSRGCATGSTRTRGEPARRRRLRRKLRSGAPRARGDRAAGP